MDVIRIRIYYLVFVSLFFLNFSGFSQKTNCECKVLMGGIDSIYMGSCKNGLAQGRGIAQGKDKYIGRFKNGLPNGRGSYYYENGDVFFGYWQNGTKDGYGELIYTKNGNDYSLKGYWDSNIYIGQKKTGNGYRILSQASIKRFSIDKIKSSSNRLEIDFDKSIGEYFIDDLQIETTSGLKIFDMYGITIEKMRFPFTISLKYSLHTSSGKENCNFMFTILDEGEWRAKILNH